MLALGPLVLAQLTSTAGATSAYMASREMYAQYCQGENAEKPMCKHQALSKQLSTTTDADAKKGMVEQMRKISADARSAQAGSATSNPFAKDYTEMKMKYCATPEGVKNGKILCSTAASRYSSSYTTDTAKAMQWFCAKPGKESETACKRAAILAKMRETEVSPEEKKTLGEQLRQYPSSYISMQGIYADYCKAQPSDSSSSLCTSLRRSTESKEMGKWYCAQAAYKEGLWCKRTGLSEKLSKIPPQMPGSPANPERMEIIKQMTEMMKSNGTGDSPYKKLSMEIQDATRLYCASSSEKASLGICATKPPPPPPSMVN